MSGDSNSSDSVDGPQELLVLASASPRRRELLASLGVGFAVVPAAIDESVSGGLTVAQAVADLSRTKAETVRGRLPNATVLAADTLVCLDGVSLGKPASEGEARSFLRLLRGRWHEVVTGVCILRRNVARCEVVTTRVEMRDYTESEIDASIELGTPLDKAGGYGIQDPGLAPARALDGCYCNVVGFPLWTIYELLHAVGFEGELSAPDVCGVPCATCPERHDSEAINEIIIPTDALVVLCGAAGSGKSTFAARSFAPSQVLSTDRLRAMISGDEADQSASPAVFSLLRTLVRLRLQRRLLTVIDSTALRARDRTELRRVARAQGVPSVAILFDSGLTTCLVRNRQRSRQVPEEILRRQYSLFERALTSVQSEGFDAVHMLKSTSAPAVRLRAPGNA